MSGSTALRFRACSRPTQDVDAVAQQAQTAKESGIEGVPCFIFDGVFAVSGAQSPEYLAGAIERAAERSSEANRQPRNSGSTPLTTPPWRAPRSSPARAG